MKRRIPCNYVLHGNAPYRILTVHGGPGASGSLGRFSAAIASSYSTVEALQTGKDVPSLVNELITQVKIHTDTPCVLVGHSWGAMLSILAAAEAPGHIAALILVGCPPLDDKSVSDVEKTRLSRIKGNEMRARYQQLLQEFSRGELKGKGMDDLMFILNSTDSYSPDRKGISSHFDPSAFASIWPQVANMRKEGVFMESLGTLNIPVHIIHGSYDPHPVEAVIRAMDQCGVSYTYDMIRECGHEPYRERYSESNFYKVLFGHLQKYAVDQQ